MLLNILDKVFRAVRLILYQVLKSSLHREAKGGLKSTDDQPWYPSSRAALMQAALVLNPVGDLILFPLAVYE